MARLVLLLLSVGLASAFPLQPENCTYDKAVEMIKGVLHGNFAKYIPADLAEEMGDIIQEQNKPELENLVELHNKATSGQLQMPHSREGAMDFLKTNAPATYARAEKLMNNTMAKYETLSAPAKAYYDEAEQSWYNQSMDGDMKQRITNQIQYFLDENDKYQALAPSVKAEFHERWPEMMNFVESPLYKSIVSILKSSNPKNLGTTVASMMALWNKNNQN